MVLALGLTATGLAPAGAGPVADPYPLPSPNPDKAPRAVLGSGHQPAPGSRLSSHSRGLLASAEATGRKSVTIMALTAPGATARVAGRLRALGGTVGYRHDKVGYVRASVPTAKVLAAARVAGVQAMDLDETVATPDPQVGTARAATGGSGPWTGPGRKTPAVNPYLPTNETGAVAFKKANPSFDGRDVTIGVLDTGVDLAQPALQTTSTGERKIIDWFSATDPLLEGDGTWRPMLSRVKGPKAEYGGAAWRLPAGAGADYAMNVFRESVTAGEGDYKGDVNRDGDTTDVWGVLYDYATNDVWVDLNQNHDFTDETPMRPYREKFQVGHFGTDNPKTAVVEQVPFTVEFRKDVDLTPAGLAGKTADFVNIGIVSGSHGTHVAGIAAGHKLFGSMDGAAPGARIVSAKACLLAGGCTSVALSEGMIELVANRKVDVVNLSIGGLPAHNDGDNVRARLYDRLIDTYGVQMFVSAGNEGPGVNTIGDPSVAPSVVSVGAAASKNTWKANYGADVTAPLWVQNYSSRGPAEDGGFKPNLLAPGSAISTIPSWAVAPSLPTVSYKLPPGYAMFNGTSMAAPEATGAAALLLSGARAGDESVLPRQLRESLYTTSKFIPGLAVAAQGTGMMDIVGAWELLKKGPAVDGRYTVSAPVCTPLSDLLVTKDRGRGLYNRCSPTVGGLNDGQRGTAAVTVTRTAGAAGASEHELRWVGNDGTFSSSTQVDLPLGKAVQVPVRVRPRGKGLHSAYLAIDSPATPLVDARMMAAVVVSSDLSKAPFTQSFGGSVERVRTVSHFVDVPKGTKSLQVDLSGIAAGAQVRWTAINPWGVPIESPTAKVSCYTNDSSDPKACNAVSRSYTDPEPGVWELQVEAKRTTPTMRNNYRLAVSAQGVEVTPATQTMAAPLGRPVPVTWGVRNTLGDVIVQGQGGPLGSAKQARPTIRNGEKQTYEVVVPAGATALEASIGKTSDLSADLDLSVYNAAGEIVGLSGKGDSEESVRIPAPPAGTYTVQVDAYSVPDQAGTQYDYLDMFTSPSLGAVAVEPVALPLASGAQGSISGVVTVKAAAAAGRSLVGDMFVVSDVGAVLGRGRII
ncbi:MAG: S8 family serine peptidase, partial [Micrococcales bacterium]|nr:S8 family serine peptidase [Micrococcales bacterium]